MSLEIALQKIEEEAEEQTGLLDLGNLGLEEIPDGLFELTHLDTLILNRSNEYSNYDWDKKEGSLKYITEARNPNRFRADDTRLSKLHRLETLVCFAAQFRD